MWLMSVAVEDRRRFRSLLGIALAVGVSGGNNHRTYHVLTKQGTQVEIWNAIELKV